MRQFTAIIFLIILATVMVSCGSKKYEVYTAPPPREGPLVHDSSAGKLTFVPLPDSLFVEFEVTVDRPCSVKVELRNLGTRLVRTIIDSVYSPGKYRIPWDKLDTNGVQIKPAQYFYKYNVCDSIFTRSLDFRYHWE